MEQIIYIIISSVAGIIMAVLTWRFQMRTEFSKILESYVSDKKYKAYYNAVDLFYRIMSAIKTNNKKEAVTLNDMLKVKQDLFMYGSDESFRAFTTYLCSSTVNQRHSFDAFLNFMIIIRKELSGGKSSITYKDILLNIMQSESELQKYYETFSQ